LTPLQPSWAAYPPLAEETTPTWIGNIGADGLPAGDGSITVQSIYMLASRPVGAEGGPQPAAAAGSSSPPTFCSRRRCVFFVSVSTTGNGACYWSRSHCIWFGDGGGGANSKNNVKPWRGQGSDDPVGLLWWGWPAA
jgi:hypothetical protein